MRPAQAAAGTKGFTPRAAQAGLTCGSGSGELGARAQGASAHQSTEGTVLVAAPPCWPRGARTPQLSYQHHPVGDAVGAQRQHWGAGTPILPCPIPHQ